MGNMLERTGAPPVQLFVVVWSTPNETKWRAYAQEAHANNYRVKMAEKGFETQKLVYIEEEE